MANVSASANSSDDITARVKLESKKEMSHDANEYRLVFIADYEDERNKEWAKFTPALRLEMSVMESVAKLFDTQKPYTLTFSPGEKDSK